MSLFAKYQPAAHGSLLPGLRLRSATAQDVLAIAKLSSSREGLPLPETLVRIEREVHGNLPRSQHRLQVALHSDRAGEQQVVGFGRSWFFQRASGATPRTAPAGWYLGGVIVDPEFRRRGVAHALTAARLKELFPEACEVFYVVNEQNRASRDLHAHFGFQEVTRDFEMPRVTFEGGVGILYQLDRARFEVIGCRESRLPDHR